MKVNAAGTFNNLSHIFFPLHVSVFIHPFRLHFLPLLHKRKKKILILEFHSWSGHQPICMKNHRIQHFFTLYFCKTPVSISQRLV